MLLTGTMLITANFTADQNLCVPHPGQQPGTRLLLIPDNSVSADAVSQLSAKCCVSSARLLLWMLGGAALHGRTRCSDPACSQAPIGAPGLQSTPVTGH